MVSNVGVIVLNENTLLQSVNPAKYFNILSTAVYFQSMIQNSLLAASDLLGFDHS